MKQLLFFALLLISVFMTWGCGGETTYPICDCEPDEICIDDECKPFPDNFEPAPEDE